MLVRGHDQLGGFDPGVLDIDQPHGDIHRLGQLCQQLDLCQLATGELQRKLVHGNPTDGWKERPVQAVPHGTTAIIAEAHVHADVGMHPRMVRATTSRKWSGASVWQAKLGSSSWTKSTLAATRAMSSALTIGIRASVTALRSG